jgi:hypothetical protein
MVLNPTQNIRSQAGDSSEARVRYHRYITVLASQIYADQDVSVHSLPHTKV